MELKIRLWFVFSAIALMLALVGLAWFQPALIPPRAIAIALPVIMVLALGSSLFIERAAKRKNPPPKHPPNAAGSRARALRVAVLGFTAAFILGMSLLIANQPSGWFPLLFGVTIVVVVSAVILVKFLERKAGE